MFVFVPAGLASVGFFLWLLYGGVLVAVALVRGNPIGDGPFVDPWAIAITAGILLVVAALAYASSRATRRRRREVQRWADAHGWSTDVKHSPLTGRWEAPPFGHSGGQVARDAVGRTDGRGTVYSFTYRCPTDRQVVMTTCPMYLGPAVWLTPEDGASRAAEAVGGQDVVVEWAEFNDRWRVESDDAKFAHAVLHPKMMERLMEHDCRGMSMLVENADVVVHAPGRTAFDRIEPMANLVLDVATLLPGFVLQDNPPLPRDITRREVMALRAERRRGRA